MASQAKIIVSEEANLSKNEDVCMKLISKLWTFHGRSNRTNSCSSMWTCTVAVINTILWRGEIRKLWVIWNEAQHHGKDKEAKHAHKQYSQA
jgi:hypothetical protein